MGFVRSRLRYAVGALVVALVLGMLSAAHEADASARAPGAVADAPDWVPRSHVTVDGLRLRATPSYSGKVIGLLYKGDDVLVKERFDPSYKKDWIGVKLTSRSASGLPYKTFGYVHKSYVK